VATTEQVGDVVRAPSYTHYAFTTDDELLYSMVGYLQKGCTLKAGSGVLPVGTVLSRITATKLFVPWDNSKSDGSELPVGLLRQAVDTGTSTDPVKLGNIVLGGLIKSSKIQLGTGSTAFIPYPTSAGASGVYTLAQIAVGLGGKLDQAAASGAYGSGTGNAYGVFKF
jgi:head decoration protein D